MDPNMLPSFVNLLEGDDLPQIGGNNTSSITPTNPHTSYPPYPPQPNYHHQSYQPYYPPQPNPRNPLGGSSQNPRSYPPPYYPPPYNDAQYLYYHPYYPLPPPNSNYFSGSSNYTPSSTPTRSTVRLGNSEADMDLSTNEGGLEEVVGGVVAKRRFKEKANNTVVDLVTKLKELSRINFDMSQKFKDFVKITEEDRAHKMMMWEQKLRLHEDRIMMMDTSTMAPGQTAYIEHRRAEIMQRRSGDSSSTREKEVCESKSWLKSRSGRGRSPLMSQKFRSPLHMLLKDILQTPNGVDISFAEHHKIISKG